MENVYKICFFGGLALAIIFLIISIVLFIVLKIPKVINDLSGRTAKKQIDEIKKKSTASSDVSKKEQAKYYNQSSGKITVKESISPATRAANRDNTTDLLDDKNKKQTEYNPDETQVLGAGGIPEDGEETTSVLANNVDDDEATAVLVADEADGEATDVLVTDEVDGEATDVLVADEADGEATDVLVKDDGADEATDVLRTDEIDEGATDVLRPTDASENDDEPATDVLRADMVGKKKPYEATVICDVVVTHTNESV